MEDSKNKKAEASFRRAEGTSRPPPGKRIKEKKRKKKTKKRKKRKPEGKKKGTMNRITTYKV